MLDFIGEMALHNWTTLNAAIAGLNEEQLKDMLEFEAENKKRESFILRMHQKYTMLRANREREELTAKCKEDNDGLDDNE